MLLLDSATLSIYEIDDAALVMPAALPPHIAFEHFETTARAHPGRALSRDVTASHRPVRASHAHTAREKHQSVHA